MDALDLLTSPLINWWDFTPPIHKVELKVLFAQKLFADNGEEVMIVSNRACLHGRLPQRGKLRTATPVPSSWALPAHGTAFRPPLEKCFAKK